MRRFLRRFLILCAADNGMRGRGGRLFRQRVERMCSDELSLTSMGPRISETPLANIVFEILTISFSVG
jgi:hypothetical protein